MAALTGKVPGNGTGTLAYTIPGSGLDVESVYAIVDATAAGGAVTVELTITDQSGVVIARKVQAETIAAGATGSATWALRLDDDGGGAGGYDTVQDEGVALAQETILDFVGAGVTATDDGANSRTKITIPGALIVSGVFATPIFGIAPNALVGFGTASLYGTRWVAPGAGSVAGLACFIGTVSGNLRLAIYDTAATTRNRLYDSGAVTTGGTNNVWIEFGTPGLTVAKGDHIDLAVVADNNSVTGAFIPMVAGNPFSGPLPTGYLVSPLGGLPLMGWVKTATAAPPATLAEAGLTPWGNVPLILVRFIPS